MAQPASKNSSAGKKMAETTYSAEEVEAALGRGISENLLSFWQMFKEINFENSISIYGYTIAKERNVLYEVAHYMPDFIMVGDDGGGQGIFLRRHDAAHLVYYLDLGALGSIHPYCMNADFFVWLHNEPTLDT